MVGQDAALAATAIETLHRLETDDSRLVSDAAKEALRALEPVRDPGPSSEATVAPAGASSFGSGEELEDDASTSVDSKSEPPQSVLSIAPPQADS